ncbi:hypothetical protein SDC9_69009 [bioreactor metagenome]|uniref:Uncharacterized protein n=1 Tax=bioreactor metagenome TaxID=1076179 RepID=A0A644Y1Z5_9ZZZZ
MAGYKIWNKTDNLYTPAGTMYTPEQVFAQTPLAQTGKFIICDAPVNMGVFMELDQTKATYKKLVEERKAVSADSTCPVITDTMTDEEVCDAIYAFETEVLAPPVTADERIAAAMEFQNLMSI